MSSIPPSEAPSSDRSSVSVPGTDIRLSRLGFGCVRLTHEQSEASAIRTLECALDFGMTHFDVARLYGMGNAERILGTFAASRRSRLTIATKVGLLPPASLAKRPGLVRLAKKVLGPFPKLLKWAKRTAASGAGSTAFNPTVIVASLETSLKTLRTDYVDILLLHEAEIADSRSDEVLAFVESQLRRGTVRVAGVGSDTNRFRRGEAMPEVYRIAQFGHSPELPSIDVLDAYRDRGCIVHSVFEPLRRLVAHAHAAPAMVRPASDRLGVDLADESVIRSLLLHYAIRTNPQGTVLFSSTSEDHITANARDAATADHDDRRIEYFAEYAREAFSDLPGVNE